MKTTFELHLRRFSVTVQDASGQQTEVPITLDKSQLQAAQIVGQSSKELIKRICGRQGLTLLDIGAADKRTVTLDLEALWNGYEGADGD